MRFAWRVGVSLLVYRPWQLADWSAGVPRNDQLDKKEKPPFIIAVLTLKTRDPLTTQHTQLHTQQSRKMCQRRGGSHVHS